MNTTTTLLASLCALFSACAAFTANAATSFSVGNATGNIERIEIDGAPLTLSAANAGFRIHDATNRKEIQLTAGKTEQSGGKTVFSAESKGNISLSAEFADKGDYILVTGVITNLKGDERGFKVDYRVNFDGKKIIYSNGLTEAIDINSIQGQPAVPKKGKAAAKPAGPAEDEGNVYPIAALRAENAALAMAIPPTEPREFGMVGSPGGMAVRFYLGVTPRTAKFPNKASFAFIIYPVNPAWAYRDALRQYYSFYNDYYKQRMPRHGGAMFNVPIGKEWPNTEDYVTDRVGGFGRGTIAADQINRAKKFNLISHAYMNVGVVEFSGLPKRPETQEEAYNMHLELCESIVEWEEGGPDPSQCELVNSSACKYSNGRYILIVRNPGGVPAKEGSTGALSFKSNPNPDLFAGQKTSIGKKALLTMDKWLTTNPDLDAVVIDSLGANWPALLNYRDDHFTFARFPLSFDPNGRVALHNAISYYEFLDAMRAKMRAKDKYLFGNGVYNYPARADVEPEHPRGRVPVGRFFMAALLDMAFAEPGINSKGDQLEFFRVSMGKKPYALTNSRWKDRDLVERWLNRTLLYGVCGCNVRELLPGGGVEQYYPEGYERDKELIKWYMTQFNITSKAGWEPVTHATATGKKVLVERFGSGDKIYFVMMNEGAAAQPCSLKIDLAALGLPASGKMAVAEIARSQPVKVKSPGVIELNLEPNKTCVIEIRKDG